MNKQNLIDEIFNTEIENSKLSRRGALKLMGISPVAAALLTESTFSSTEVHASDAKGKILIVGGGAGAIMTLSRLKSALSNPDITIIAPNDVHLYQPGQVFIAAGEYAPEDIVFDNHDWIDDSVTWIKDEVANFDPDNNKVTTRGGQEVAYDYMVVATGIVYHYEWIDGLSADDIGKNGISSVYLNDLEHGTATGAEVTNQMFKDVHADATAGKTPKVLCTLPNTPIKCGGAPMKILYLCDDYLRKDGLSADFTFGTNNKKLFSLPTIDATLHKISDEYGNIKNLFSHNLVKVDKEKKVATFRHIYETKGEYDEDLEMYDMITKVEEVEVEYDYLHVVPPMSPPEAVVNSPLGWQKGTAKGWLEVDKHSLQHRRYKNVFGIGDVLGIPMGKTGGSARHHGPVLVENLIAEMEKKELKAVFDGYTVCPLKVNYGQIVMAEFNYNGLAPSFSFLDPAEPRWVWWAFDLYMLKPMYKYLMMRGLM